MRYVISDDRNSVSQPLLCHRPRISMQVDNDFVAFRLNGEVC